MRLRALFTTVLLAATVSACSGFVPNPPPSSDYVGVWQDSEMTLKILPSGQVEQEVGHTSISCPAKTWEADKFTCKIIGAEFEMTQAPTLIDGKWVMKVDGHTLVRTFAPTTAYNM